MPTLFLSRKDIKGLLDMSDVIVVVEQAFKDYAQGKAAMPAKAYLLVERGDFRAMPAAVPGAAGVKWVNVHTNNPAFQLPTVMGIVIYNDPETGYPLAVMDATESTAYRTGAAAAVASKYLARKDSHTLGIVGAGRQAYTQLMAHTTLFQFDEIRVTDVSSSAVEKLIGSFPEYPVKQATLAETVASDIVCTVTPAREPIVKKEWVKPGSHINAMGADAQGKEELEPLILKLARVVVDDVRQASAGGEINVPISKGLFSVNDIHANLGEVIAGKKPGRTDSRQITIFDSTGIAIHDIAVGKLIFDRAKKSSSYLSLDFIEG